MASKRGSSFLLGTGVKAVMSASVHRGYIHNALILNDVSSPCHPGSRSLYDPHRFSVAEDLQRYKNFVPSADGLTCPVFTLQPLPPSSDQGCSDVFAKAVAACENAVGKENLPDAQPGDVPLDHPLDPQVQKVHSLLKRDAVNLCLAALSTQKEMFTVAGCQFSRYAFLMLAADAFMEVERLPMPVPALFFGAALTMPFERGVNVAATGDRGAADALSRAIILRHLAMRTKQLERFQGSVAMAHLGRSLALNELLGLKGGGKLEIPNTCFLDDPEIDGSKKKEDHQSMKTVDAVTTLERALEIGVTPEVAAAGGNVGGGFFSRVKAAILSQDPAGDDATRGCRLRHSVLVSAATLLEERGGEAKLTVDGVKRGVSEVQDMAETLRIKLGDKF